jgi:hypothetical protein
LNTVIAASQAVLLNIQIDQRSAVRGYISGSLQFHGGSELHFREFVDLSLPEPRLMYAYHFQDAEKALIVRYDNAVHRPLLTQAEHKHTPSGVQVAPAPTLAQVVDEILT